MQPLPQTWTGVRPVRGAIQRDRSSVSDEEPLSHGNWELPAQRTTVDVEQVLHSQQFKATRDHTVRSHES